MYSRVLGIISSRVEISGGPGSQGSGIQGRFKGLPSAWVSKQHLYPPWRCISIMGRFLSWAKRGHEKTCVMKTRKNFKRFFIAGEFTYH